MQELGSIVLSGFVSCVECFVPCWWVRYGNWKLFVVVCVCVGGWCVEVGSGRRVFRTSDERNSTYNLQPIKDVRSLDSYWLIYKWDQIDPY